MSSRIRSYMMPVAMITGAVLYKPFGSLSSYTPWLIALMLFISYSNLSLKDIRISKLHICLLAIQTIGSIIVFGIILPFSRLTAEGAMVCILAPTASSAIVITAMLGGNIASLTTYTLLSNLAVTLAAPIAFSFSGELKEFPFIQSISIIFIRVSALLVLPFAISLLSGWLFPNAHKKIRKMQFLSFILWTIALAIVTGKTIGFIIEHGKSHIKVELIMATASLIVCIGQFFIGRRLGKRYNDTIAGGQGLGQKNTILAIWMAQTFLNPLSSIAPGAYILWQNIINSYQVWRQQRRV